MIANLYATKREMRELKPEKNFKLINVKDVIEHIKNQPSIKPENFLQEDFYSSARFKKSKRETRAMSRMRFMDRAQTIPCNRSYVGTK